MARDLSKLLAALREHALANCSETLRPVATLTECDAVAEDLGFALPEFLINCYTQIGNGGFGPGYGLIGIGPNGNPSSIGDLVAGYRDFTLPVPDDIDDDLDGDWPEKMLPFCDWGCNIYSCVSCLYREYPVFTINQSVLYPKHFSIESYFERWLRGSPRLQ